MSLENKIEAVKRVTKVLEQEPQSHMGELERIQPDQGHFQSLLDTVNKTTPSFQKIDGSFVASDGIQGLEKNPILADNNVTAQGSGSATDQDQKKRHSQAEEGDAVKGVAAVGSKGKVNPGTLMDEVKKLNGQIAKTAQLTPEDLKNQTQTAIAQLEDIKSHLGQVSAADIKPSYTNLLRNRLTHIDDTLKIALSKAGVERTSTATVTSTTTNHATPNPIERFIGYLTNSQHELEHLSDAINQLNLTNTQISPANMLALQIKVGYVQQQIELFTSLLNKALESTKTIMNVQV